MDSSRIIRRTLFVLFVAIVIGSAPSARSPRIAQAGGAAQPGNQGALAPQTPGAYVLNLSTGKVVPVGPLGQYGSPVEEAWSPDGRNLAVASAEDAFGGHGGLQVVEIASGAVTPVAASNQGQASNLIWSPDSAQLAFVFQGQVGDLGSTVASLQLWRSQDKTIQSLVPSGARFAAWSPDGSAIAATIVPPGRDPTGSGGRIVTLNPKTGLETQTIVTGPTAECQLGLSWSPNGRYVAYSGHGFHEGCLEGANLGLWTWDAQTSTTRQLYDGTASASQWMADGSVLAEVAAVGGPSGLLPISLVSFAPDGSGQRVLAGPIPNMFPPPNPLFQTANGVAMYGISQCDGAAAWAIESSSREPHNVTSPTMYAFGAHLSADGRLVAFSGEGSKGAYLALAPVDGGRVTTPLTGDPAIVPGDFSPDSNWLAFSVLSEWPFFCLGD
jgi:Tol biopolymer transport system component